MATQHFRDGQFNPTSPHSSSGGAESFKGTPDTRLTTFSPEDDSAKRLPGQHSHGSIKFGVSSPSTIDLKGTLYRRNALADRDPFITTAGSGPKTAQKLSPTASSFFPLPNALGSQGPVSEPGGNSRGMPESLTVSGGGQSPVSTNPAEASVYSYMSTDTRISRCLLISSRSKNIDAAQVDMYLSALRQQGCGLREAKEINGVGGKVYVRFSSIRDAILVTAKLSEGNDWSGNFITRPEYSQVVDPASGLFTAHEGQVQLAVFGLPPGVSTTQELETFIKGLLRAEGDLFAFKPQPGVDGSLLSAIVEYSDNDDSLRAVSKLNGLIFEEQHLQLCLTLHRPDIPAPSSFNQESITSPVRSASKMSDLAQDFQNLDFSRSESNLSPGQNSFFSTPVRAVSGSGYPVQGSYGMVPLFCPTMPLSPPYALDQGHGQNRNQNVHSPLGPSINYALASPMVSPTSPYSNPDYASPRQLQAAGRSDGRRQNAIRVSRSPHYNVTGQHNHVDVDRIQQGIDVRTTIMLRNIPNKVDQAMLKEIVDYSSWGKYDFMYLRIDFANNCNVGYAFINFVDPLDIIEFVRERGNKKWNCFKSDKIAEISYATIQGKDCLVQKFRNSSVMLEPEHYRPKLYYTINGPLPDLAGQEEEFPKPDNPSKMKRSCENAEHVGLFTPNAGQHFRDEQRRRRSQYDRGTRLAALEEYDYDAAMQHWFPQQ